MFDIICEWLDTFAAIAVGAVIFIPTALIIAYYPWWVGTIAVIIVILGLQYAGEKF